MTNKSRTFKDLLLSAVGFTILYTPIQQSFAQNVLEEVVVTSRRYEESITDAPLAVSVMDNNFLSTNRIDSIQDILELSPGTTWGQFTKAQPNLSLRGMNGGNFGNASLESAVQVVYDGVPATKAFMMTLPTYDLSRVEIMRGPQGTTFGRNATLGLMHFVAARPSQEFEAEISGSAGTLDLLGTNGFVSGPINDTVSARLAFNYQDTDGAMEDRYDGHALESSENISIRGSVLFEPSDDYSSYVKVEYIEDKELPTVRRGLECFEGNGWLNNDTLGPPPFDADNGGFPDPINPVANQGYVDDCDPWKADIDETLDRRVDREIWVITNENVINFGDITVTNVNGFQNGTHLNAQSAFGTPYAVRDQIVRNDAQVLSTELRIDNHASGNRFRWLAGVSYLIDEELRNETNIGFPNRGGCAGQFDGVNPITDCPQWSLFQRGDAETTALGIFGEITFDFTDQLSASFGARYSDDSRSLDWDLNGWGEAGGLAGVGLGNADMTRDCNAVSGPDPLGRGPQAPHPGPPGAGIIANVCGTPANPVGFETEQTRDFDNFSLKAVVNYAFNDNNNFYASYSEGFKAGGFQHDARSQTAFDLLIDSETVENYEIGWKGAYDTLIFAITAFIMDQSNSQQGNLVAIQSGNANMVFNVPGIDNKGVELEATWATPLDGFTLGGSLGYYDQEFKDGSAVGANFDGTTGALLPAGEDISGQQPQNVPDLTATLWGTYEWNLDGGSNVRFRMNWTHRSSVWGQNGDLSNRDGLNREGTGPMFLRPEQNKWGFNVDWTSADDRLTLGVWGKNMDNDPDYINYGPGTPWLYNPGQAGPNGGVEVSRPVGTTGRRQMGGTITYRFN